MSTRLANPPHGTADRYNHGTSTEPPCRSDCCRKAKLVQQRQRARDLAYGRSSMTDSAPVREHVEALHATGLSLMQIARGADVAPGAARRLLGREARRPAPARVRVETARRLLALAPSLDLWAEGDVVPALGSRRRIQALVVSGRTLTIIADALGTSFSQVHEMVHGKRDAVRARTARAVIELTEQWWDQPPPQRTKVERDRVKSAQRLAARNAWVALACWDNPDDPTEQPKGARPR